MLIHNNSHNDFRDHNYISTLWYDTITTFQVQLINTNKTQILRF